MDLILLNFVIWQDLTVLTNVTLTQACIWYLEKGQAFFFSKADKLESIIFLSVCVFVSV